MVEGASSIALRQNISQLTVGLTVVAFGTSMPEMVVNVISSYKGYNEVVFGNIIGSNIFNLYLILGIAGVIYPLTVTKNTVWREIPFSLVITIILLFLVNDQFIANKTDRLGLVDGFVLLGLFAVFVYYIIKNLRTEDLIDDVGHKQYSRQKTILMVFGGIAGLAIGGKLVVDNAVDIAHYYDVSEKLIGLTIVSAGTSLPELATSTIAAFKRKADIAVGNIIGSNIINITLVLGISALIKPLAYTTDLNVDMAVLLLGTMLLFFFMFTLTVKKLDRWEAVIFLVGAFAYLIFLFIRK